MPNGHDKNWVRLPGAIDGFRMRFGCWPVRVRMFPGSLRNIQEDLFSADLFAELYSKVQLIPDEAPMVAEDVSGNPIRLEGRGFRVSGPTRTRQWLGFEPDQHE
jgi:hypothetical protein